MEKFRYAAEIELDSYSHRKKSATPGSELCVCGLIYKFIILHVHIHSPAVCNLHSRYKHFIKLVMDFFPCLIA